jgi:hypothetical protein
MRTRWGAQSFGDSSSIERLRCYCSPSSQLFPISISSGPTAVSVLLSAPER